MIIKESAEMYLETILVLSQQTPTVRMVDIANKMNFSKPSVSVFLKDLRNNGYVSSDDNGVISLTEKGRAIAERIYDRHRLLTKLLVAIGVDEETASSDACKMEHHISDKTYDCLKKHYDNYTE